MHARIRHAVNSRDFVHGSVEMVQLQVQNALTSKDVGRMQGLKCPSFKDFCRPFWTNSSPDVGDPPLS